MKKIAICLFGFIGNPFGRSHEDIILQKKDKLSILKVILEINYAHFKKYIIDCNKDIHIDIFIHSWQTEIKKEIINTYKPTNYIIEDVIIDDTLLNLYAKNLISRMLGNIKVINLMKKYKKINNINYDQVILTRFDAISIKPIILNKYFNNNIKIENFGSNECIYKNYKNYNKNIVRFLNKHGHLHSIETIKKYNLTKISNVNFGKKYIRIGTHFIMGPYNLLTKFEDYYHYLLKFRKLFLINHLNIKEDRNPGGKIYLQDHIFFGNIILDLLSKNNEINIQYIKELYYTFPNILVNIGVSENQTYFLSKQLYFRVPGHSKHKVGSLKGCINGCLLNLNDLFKKYNLDYDLYLS